MSAHCLSCARAGTSTRTPITRQYVQGMLYQSICSTPDASQLPWQQPLEHRTSIMEDCYLQTWVAWSRHPWPCLAVKPT